MAEPRSSLWRGRPARELARSEPLGVVSRLFKASGWGLGVSLSRRALSVLRVCAAVAVLGVCVCVSRSLTCPHTHTPDSAVASAFADQSGGCLCWL